MFHKCYNMPTINHELGGNCVVMDMLVGNGQSEPSSNPIRCYLMDILLGNGQGVPSSNTLRDYFRFTSCKYFGERNNSNYPYSING